ncbi:MAG: hypothetical protein QM726_14750 [Chitinophagaceae bacterium]
MNWLKKILEKAKPKKHLTNYNSGKSFDKQYYELGAFTYYDDGFTISYEDFTKKVQWSDITQLNVYKTDLFTIDRIDMEIAYDDKCFTISEDLPGWYQFVLKTKEIFPEIPKDWDLTIMHPAFATNYTTIYDKIKANYTNIT